MPLRHHVFTRLIRARDLLQEVHDRRLTVEDIAREVEISPFTSSGSSKPSSV